MNSTKRKLLIIAGAGSTLGSFGMPSVAAIHTLFLGYGQALFYLRSDPTRTLYSYIYEQVESYWTATLPAHLQRQPSFEDILYAVYTITGTYPAGLFTSALGALVDIKAFPELIHIRRPTRVDQHVLRHLSEHLIDNLLDDFRTRYRMSSSLFSELRDFFFALHQDFDVAICTTNYDNLILRASAIGIDTGFDLGGSGLFDPARLFNRQSWPCLLHLHGSVHFDMNLSKGDLHAIFWQNDLNQRFHQNSFGRSVNHSVEGKVFPTSAIVAGYGTTSQLQRFPFRTYYSELDRLVCNTDAVVFLGYGFGDSHLNNAFADLRDSRDRPIVVIDYADDAVMTAGSGTNESTTVLRAMALFKTSPYCMTALGSGVPMAVKNLKTAKEFDRCTDIGCRLSIWYNGMLEGCRNIDRVLAELN